MTQRSPRPAKGGEGGSGLATTHTGGMGRTITAIFILLISSRARDTPSAASSWSGTRQVLYSITKHAMRRSADEIGATSISFRPKVFSDPASNDQISIALALI